MGGVVVADDVNLLVLGHQAVNQFEKLEPFLMPVLGHGAATAPLQR
jgi:hypothetical protein